MKEPQPPYIDGYLIVATFSVVGVWILFNQDPQTFPLGWLGFLFVLSCIGGAFGLLVATATRRYKNAKSAWDLLQRSRPAVPDPHTIYTINGVVSMRAADGTWMEIGEGAGTFYIKPVNAQREQWDTINRTLERGAEARRKKQTPPTG